MGEKSSGQTIAAFVRSCCVFVTIKVNLLYNTAARPSLPRQQLTVFQQQASSPSTAMAVGGLPVEAPFVPLSTAVEMLTQNREPYKTFYLLKWRKEDVPLLHSGIKII